MRSNEDEIMELRTVDPVPPDFSSHRCEIIKVGGSCFTGVYKRYFKIRKKWMSEQAFIYYANEKDNKER